MISDNIARMSSKTKTRDCILIESGPNGWGLIEYEELLQSALEISDNTKVKKITFKSTWARLINILKTNTHHRNVYFLYSPRSQGDYKTLNAQISLWLLLLLASLKSIRVVFMMCGANDVAFRKLARMTSKFNHTVISVLPPSIINKYDHKIRAKGPYLLPISKKTRSYLDNMNKSQFFSNALTPKVLLSGNSYGKRKQFFDSIIPFLDNAGLHYQLSHRSETRLRNSSLEYWNEFLNSKYVVSTSFMDGSDVDMISQHIANYKHLVYRFSEVFCCRRLLLIQEPEECESIFMPNVHYIAVNDPRELVDRILFFEANPNEYDRIINQAYMNYHEKLKTNSPFTLMEEQANDRFSSLYSNESEEA